MADQDPSKVETIWFDNTTGPDKPLYLPPLLTFKELMAKYASVDPTLVPSLVSDSPPIYTPTGNSIQTEQKGRLTLRRDESEVRTFCNCGDCEDDESDEPRIASTVWGLNTKLKLQQEAADFYLLYDLNLDGLDNGLFQAKIDLLSTQFQAYTDLAIGGEIRHLLGRRQNGVEIPEALMNLLQQPSYHSGRSVAWQAWYAHREVNRTAALYDIIKGFRAFEKSGYGGETWANIADTLRKVEEGEITPLMFIDICWGLEHNSGSYFSKVWMSGYLQKVLNANLYWNLPTLYKYATPDIMELHKEASCSKETS